MDVVIAGAGITGLAAAISLRRSGHKVTIYERSSLNNEVGAAINVPPNAGRFLLRWGLDPAPFVASLGMYFMSPTTLEELSSFDHSQNADLFGAPLYYAHRVDLHSSLKHMATEPDGPGTPVAIHLGSAVESYDANTPSITLSNGTVIAADLVIAADGVHSNAIEAISGKTTPPPQPGKHSNCAYRFLIPRSDLEADPETRFFNQGYQQFGCRLYSDNDHPAGRRMITYTCRNHEIHNFVVICDNDNITSKREDWHAAVSQAEVQEQLAGYHAGLLAVIKKATDVKRWPLLYRPPIGKWYKGKMALAGDAAHPMLPHHGQGGAQGLEDGLAIGLVLHGADTSQIIERLAIYEKVRRNRAASIQILSNVAFDDKVVPEELASFLEGRPVPKSIHDMIHLAYDPNVDVVQTVVKHVKEIDPSFRVPDGFFPVN